MMERNGYTFMVGLWHTFEIVNFNISEKVDYKKCTLCTCHCTYTLNTRGIDISKHLALFIISLNIKHTSFNDVWIAR